MRIRKDKEGKFIDTDKWIGRDFYISYYYLSGDCEIDLGPFMVTIKSVGDYDIVIDPIEDSLSPDSLDQLDKFIKTLGYSSMEFFESYIRAIDYYRECLIDEIDNLTSKSRELINKLRGL